MAHEVTLTLFTPAEAEVITGVSTVLQRDWRRRGYLHSHEGPARFNVFALAEMTVMEMLSPRGGPQRTFNFMGSIGCRVVGHVLASQDAWEGDHGDAPGATWNEKAAWLLRELTNIEPHRFFLWYPDDLPGFATSVDAVFDYKLPSGNPYVSGPLVVLDLEALGKMMLKRAGRPLAHSALTDD